MGITGREWIFESSETEPRALRIGQMLRSDDPGFTTGEKLGSKALTIYGDTGNLDVAGGIAAAGPIKIGKPTFTEGINCSEDQMGSIASQPFPNGFGGEVAIPMFCNGATWTQITVAQNPLITSFQFADNPIAVSQGSEISWTSTGTDQCYLSGKINNTDTSEVVYPTSHSFKVIPYAEGLGGVGVPGGVLSYTLRCAGDRGDVSQTITLDTRSYKEIDPVNHRVFYGEPNESCKELLTRITGTETPVNNAPTYIPRLNQRQYYFNSCFYMVTADLEYGSYDPFWYKARYITNSDGYRSLVRVTPPVVVGTKTFNNQLQLLPASTSEAVQTSTYYQTSSGDGVETSMLAAAGGQPSIAGVFKEHDFKSPAAVPYTSSRYSGDYLYAY